MIGLDTNVLVRHLTQDDELQSATAGALLDGLTEEAPGFISLVVLVELFWVLRNGARLTAEHVHQILERLLDAPRLEVEDEESVTRALAHARAGADFADALIGDTADLYGCTEVVTFDRRAGHQLGWRLLTAH